MTDEVTPDATPAEAAPVDPAPVAPAEEPVAPAEAAPPDHADVAPPVDPVESEVEAQEAPVEDDGLFNFNVDLSGYVVAVRASTVERAFLAARSQLRGAADGEAKLV